MVRFHLRRFEAWAISFTPLCPCLSEETLKAVGPNSCVSSILGCLEYNYLRLEVQCRTFGQGDRGSKPPVAERRTFRSKGPGFKTTCCHFKTWANLFTPLCSCLSEETLKAVGPFYLVSMPGEVKDPTQGVNV